MTNINMEHELDAIDAEERVLLNEERIARASGNDELARTIRAAMDSRRQQFAMEWLHETADDLPTTEAVERSMDALRRRMDAFRVTLLMALAMVGGVLMAVVS